MECEVVAAGSAEANVRVALPRTVVVASADASFRQRLSWTLTALRWKVRAAAGGAEALAHLEECAAEALLLDSWLPDLEVGELAALLGETHPQLDVIRLDVIRLDAVRLDAIQLDRIQPDAGGSACEEAVEGRKVRARSPRRNELLHALRRAQEQDADGAVWNSAPHSPPVSGSSQASSQLPSRTSSRTSSRASSRVLGPESNLASSGSLSGPSSGPCSGRFSDPFSGPSSGRFGPAPNPASSFASLAVSSESLGRQTAVADRLGEWGGAASEAPSKSVESLPVPQTPVYPASRALRSQPTFRGQADNQSAIPQNDGHPHGSALKAVSPLKPASPLIPGMIGSGPAMLELARMVRLVAPRSATVLVEGATGTGKEVVARALHRLGLRADKPFTVLNCAAIPEALLEAELFGHTRGAFTGAVQSRTGRIEAAHGGTLFLDEIGEMPLGLQAKLLRFLECGELQRVGENEPVRVDVRVVAATHQPLEQRSAEGRFRSDLYYRLAVFPLYVPSLSERMEDLPLLAAHFLAKLGEDAPVKRLSEAAMLKLRCHNWPGNVREFSHVLERAAILAEERPEIGADEIRLGSGR